MSLQKKSLDDINIHRLHELGSELFLVYIPYDKILHIMYVIHNWITLRIVKKTAQSNEVKVAMRKTGILTNQKDLPLYQCILLQE